jgi:hypothetical protein
MNTSLQDLNELASEVGPEITPVEITIGKKTKTFHFRRVSYLRARQIVSGPMKFNPPSKDADGNEVAANVSIDPDKMPTRNVSLIYESLVNADGTPFMNLKDIEKLPPQLGDKLFAAAEKVNALNDAAVEDAVKNSEATGADATSSSSPNGAAAPSPS